VLAAVTWPQASDGTPVDRTGLGSAAGAGDRLAGLRLLPLVSIGLYLTLLLIPRITSRREGGPLFAGSFALIRFAAVAVMTATYGMLQLTSQRNEVHLARVVPLAIGALFLVIGTQLRQGRRTGGQAAWRRTNRLTGWLMEGAGLLVMVAGLLGSALLMVAAVAGTVLGAVGLAFYSHRTGAEDTIRDEPPGANAV
jgi:uncharacterized membrane protein